MDTRAGSLDAPLEQGSSLFDDMRAAFGLALGLRPSRVEATHEGARRVRVVGALDKRAARALKARARELVSLPPAAWTIDLADVSSWDGDGIAALVYALDVSTLQGHELALADPGPALRAVLERAQLHHLFVITQRDARAS